MFDFFKESSIFMKIFMIIVAFFVIVCIWQGIKFIGFLLFLFLSVVAGVLFFFDNLKRFKG